MPALPPYVPTKEADFTSWLAKFSTLISANPPAYGLTTSDAATIAAQNADNLLPTHSVGAPCPAAAYGPITSPATKTAQAVSAKNVAKVTVTAQNSRRADRNEAGVDAKRKMIGLLGLQSGPLFGPQFQGYALSLGKRLGLRPVVAKCRRRATTPCAPHRFASGACARRGVRLPSEGRSPGKPARNEP